MKIRRFFGLLFIGLIGSWQVSTAQCTDMNSERIKNLLGSAIYDNFRMTKITSEENPYDIEFQVDLLRNYVYKLVFDMTEKSEGVVVKLFDLGDLNSKMEPNLLYVSSEDVMTENSTFEVNFEAPKTRLLIKYEVKDATFPGCVSFVLGVEKKLDKKSNSNLKK